MDDCGLHREPRWGAYRIEFSLATKRADAIRSAPQIRVVLCRSLAGGLPDASSAARAYVHAVSVELVRLSELIHGDVVDLVARPGADPPVVTGVVRRDSPPRTLAADELLLKRDVLDSQIVDTVGKRLERVGDIELAREPDGTLVSRASRSARLRCCAGSASDVGRRVERTSRSTGATSTSRAGADTSCWSTLRARPFTGSRPFS
jgi:hypothetical protein